MLHMGSQSHLLGSVKVPGNNRQEISQSDQSSNGYVPWIYEVQPLQMQTDSNCFVG